MFNFLQNVVSKVVFVLGILDKFFIYDIYQNIVNFFLKGNVQNKLEKEDFELVDKDGKKCLIDIFFVLDKK